LTLSDLSPDNISKTAKKLTGQGPNRDLAHQWYQEAEALYRKGGESEGSERTTAFQQAAIKFNQAADRWPDSALQQDALFYAGECFFFTDQYPKANEAYEKLVKAFPNNRYMDVVDQRRFAIARWWLAETDKSPESFWMLNITNPTRPWRDTRGHSLRVFDKIRLDDPTGRLADDAALAAGNAYFAQKDYMRAEEFYSD
jgi:tetratricopeptide (TPR) repeat protein